MVNFGTTVFLQTLRSHPLAARAGKLLPAQTWELRPSRFFSLTAFILVASLLLGGGTRGGFLSDAILELFAIPAFLMSLSSLIAPPQAGDRLRAKWPLILCGAIMVLPLLQLVPLPPWLWQFLPRRGDIVAVFTLVGRPLPWLPVSVAPTETWLSALSLLPPVAVFLCVIQLSYRERRLLTFLFLGVGVFAAMIGLLQVAQGPSSPLRFFTFTNSSEAVGFFANRNHFAASLYVLLLYAAAWATDVAFSTGSLRDLRNLETSSIGSLTASLLVLIILMAAETITRSRAGLGLMIIGMFGAFALPLADRRRATGVTPVKLMIGAMILAGLLVVQFALYRVFDRFAVDSLEGARVIFARNTISAAWAYMPFGSGFGTFTSVYPMFERAQDTLANIYANHAHNDILEVWLEGGVIGAALMIAAVIWLGLRSSRIWRRPPHDIHALDILFARAATMAIALIIMHSFVDYPLRTDAMMAVLAFSCALLIEPPPNAKPVARQAVAVERAGRRDAAAVWQPAFGSAALPLPKVEETASAPAQHPVPAPLASGGRWGEDIAWPEEWNKPSGAGTGAKKIDR